MFTGIITDVGRLTDVQERSHGARALTIATAYDMRDVDLGASIACSGVCLTVTGKGPDGFTVDVSPETLRCTAIEDWDKGARINLERALKVGGELGGHIVTGHVDAVGEIVSIGREGEHTLFHLLAPLSAAPFIAQKGSIAVNGVSLTVNAVEDRKEDVLFGVNIIPHTIAHTNFGDLSAGSRVNLEIDLLARYAARLRTFNR